MRMHNKQIILTSISRHLPILLILLLLTRQPPKGSAAGWQQRAADFRAAAQTLLRAMERRDFAAAQQSLRELPQTCAACHAEYR